MFIIIINLLISIIIIIITHLFSQIMNIKVSKHKQNENKIQLRSLSFQLLHSILNDMNIRSSNEHPFINEILFKNVIKIIPSISANAPLCLFTYITKSKAKYINQQYKQYNNITLFKYVLMQIIIAYLIEIQSIDKKSITTFLKSYIDIYLRLYRINIFTYENITNIALFLYYLSLREININTCMNSPFQCTKQVHVHLSPCFIYSIKLFVNATIVKQLSVNESVIIIKFINNLINIINNEEMRYLFYYNDIYTTNFVSFCKCISYIHSSKQYQFEKVFIILLVQLYRFRFNYNIVMTQLVSPYEKILQGIKVKTYETLINELHISNIPLQYIVDVNNEEMSIINKDAMLIREGFYFNSLSSCGINVSDICIDEYKGCLFVFSFKIIEKWDRCLCRGKCTFDLFNINDCPLNKTNVYKVSFECESINNVLTYKMILFIFGMETKEIKINVNENYVIYTLIHKKDIEIRYYNSNSNDEYYEQLKLNKKQSKYIIPHSINLTIGKHMDNNNNNEHNESTITFNGYMGSLLIISNAGELFQELCKKKLLKKLGSNYKALFYLQYENKYMFNSNYINDLISDISINIQDNIQKEGKFVLINADNVLSECIAYERIAPNKKDNKNNSYVDTFISDNIYNNDLIQKDNNYKTTLKQIIKGDLIYNNCLYGKVKATGLYTKENHPFKYNNTLNEFINCNGFSLISLQFEYLYQLLCRISDDSLNNNTRNETITQEFLSKM